MDSKVDKNIATGHKAPTTDIRGLLIELASDLLEITIDPEISLVSHGLDSIGAEELLEAFRNHGYELDYFDLLDELSVNSLVPLVQKKTIEGPVASSELTNKPVPLTGPQVIWSKLEKEGWESWANISLCISMPASLIPAAHLPSIVQSLCDSNDAMRMKLIASPTDEHQILQTVIADFQVNIRMSEAPDTEKGAMRLVEEFEGEQTTPFEASTRALVLSSANRKGHHWLCISMHHIFSDRIAMHSLAKQLMKMIPTNQLRPQQGSTLSYTDYALWQQQNTQKDELIRSEEKLSKLLAKIDSGAICSVPRLVQEKQLDLGELPSHTTLPSTQSIALESLASELKTTTPLLLHALFSVLVDRLTKDEKSLSGKNDSLICHVASNRESFSALHDLVGCLDTSIPVAIGLDDGETIQSLCSKTRRKYAETHKCVASLPRGDWFERLSKDPMGAHSNIFECVPHINIIRSPNQTDSNDIRIHPVKRLQRTRWGLLLRVTLPNSNQANPGKKPTLTPEFNGIQLHAFAEHRVLAILVNHCFAELVKELLSKPKEIVGELLVKDILDTIIERTEFSSTQLKKTALQSSETCENAFIWHKLISRQQRWYKHNEHSELIRDKYNRFIGTSANPFPFTQLDKLKEREYLDCLGIPQPTLLHNIPRETLKDSLLEILPSLPSSFVIKPVGAGHSFGVTVVREGKDLSRNGLIFDAINVAEELTQMADRGYCIHQDHVFKFNFSSFLIEELVVDENGHDTPTDYKVFMAGEKLLWIQLHFKSDGHTWVAFVTEDFELLQKPAWNPSVCWRTHGALVCNNQSVVNTHKPSCLKSIVEQSKKLGAKMNIFVRLDWYADVDKGPLMGEITTFPHMLQPRPFYSAWANKTVKDAWQNPDGGILVDTESRSKSSKKFNIDAEQILDQSRSNSISLSDFIPDSQTLWARETKITYQTLSQYIKDFELASWGIKSGDRIALMIDNSVQMGALLLATMNRYIAMPIATTTPSSLLATQLQESNIKTLLVIAGTEEEKKAKKAMRIIPELAIIPLRHDQELNLPLVSYKEGAKSISSETVVRRPNDPILMLRTSGTTGAAKTVSFTLSRLILAGASINQSLQLMAEDQGISMLPLHHIGGISCNLIAPMLSGASMSFHNTYDPKVFFEELRGKQGASWCYLVSNLWEMLLDYAKAHPELKQNKDWPRLRLLRSAGSALPHNIALKLADFFGKDVSILPSYGMTEAMPIAAPPSTYKLERPGSVGIVLPNVEIEIVNPSETENSAALPIGETGEIVVKGSTVIQKDDDLEFDALNSFTPRGYFRTGDMGKIYKENGTIWLYVTGRIKEVINRGGESIAPTEIEDVLRGYPGWQDSPEKQFMVFSRAHKQLTEDIALAVAPCHIKLDLVQLNKWAAQHLPNTMLPQTLVFLPEIPRSQIGKAQRSQFSEYFNTITSPAELGKLQTYHLDGLEGEATLQEEKASTYFDIEKLEQNSNHTLTSVTAFIGDILGKEFMIGPDTRFDDVGVNSLAAIALSNDLSRHFGVDIPTWFIHDFPTPRAVYSQIFKPLTTDSLKSNSHVQTNIELSVAKSENRPFRILLLHGEASDAELMDFSMQATHWTGHLDDIVEFEFIDAPHLCAPKPQFHPAAAEVGLYNKPKYRSWGTHNIKSLEHSIETVLTKIKYLEPIDGIGGICDGALIAAIVAARTESLKLYINIASNALNRLPEKLAKNDWSINCKSLHFISSKDEVVPFEELMDIPKRCRNALLLQHESGHAVPLLEKEFKKAILATLNDLGFSIDSNEDSVSINSEVVPQQKLVGNTQKASPAYCKPSTELEKKLANIWANILMMDQLPGIDDNFFDLGGSSLIALYLLREIEKELNIELSHKVLLKLSTIRALAKTIESTETTESREVESPDKTTLKLLNESGISEDIFRRLFSLTASWPGKRSRDESLIFGMNTEAKGTPIFWCCQRVFAFSQMAKHIGSPLYGMCSGVGVMDGDQADFELLAKYYAAEIMAIDNEGPYVIGGNCRSARIAIQIAHELKANGKKISLLCLMEQVVPISYSGRMAILFGHLSKNNPFHYFEHPQESWQNFYRGDINVETIQGRHGQFFKESNIPVLVKKLKEQVEQIDTEAVYDEAPLEPILPKKGRSAKIMVPKEVNVRENGKKLAMNINITNTSPISWTSEQGKEITLGYWIYSEKIKPPIYYGMGMALPNNLAPGSNVSIPLEVPIPSVAGSYQIHLDLVDNKCRWFQYDGSPVAKMKIEFQ